MVTLWYVSKDKSEPLIDKMGLSIYVDPKSLRVCPEVDTRYPGSSLPTSITFNTRTSPLFTHARDFAVDLGGVLALGVRVLRCGHLQDAHSKGVDVHCFIVLLLVHLRGHELWCSCPGSEVKVSRDSTAAPEPTEDN